MEKRAATVNIATMKVSMIPKKSTRIPSHRYLRVLAHIPVPSGRKSIPDSQRSTSTPYFRHQRDAHCLTESVPSLHTRGWLRDRTMIPRSGSTETNAGLHQVAAVNHAKSSSILINTKHPPLTPWHLTDRKRRDNSRLSKRIRWRSRTMEEGSKQGIQK